MHLVRQLVTLIILHFLRHPQPVDLLIPRLPLLLKVPLQPMLVASFQQHLSFILLVLRTTQILVLRQALLHLQGEDLPGLPSLLHLYLEPLPMEKRGLNL